MYRNLGGDYWESSRRIPHGLTGAVKVDGIIYQPPIVLAQMPAVGTLDDESIASILSYIRRAWAHEAEPIAAATVAAIREETANRSTPWTALELAELEQK